MDPPRAGHLRGQTYCIATVLHNVVSKSYHNITIFVDAITMRRWPFLSHFAPRKFVGGPRIWRQ
ncbi:MAG: hypothetical protein NTV22_05170, partial [bacterium]|nr:hypothetical protein [bacterium]